MKDLYKTLGIQKDATPDEVKKAYFVMAKKYHPDSGDEAEVKKFYEISEAYRILSDKEERRAYDLALDGGKITSELVGDAISAKPTDESSEIQDDEHIYRQKEKYNFQRNIFWQGVLRIVGFALLMAAIGYGLNFIVTGPWIGSIIAGFLFGLIWSINQNFDVNSFVQSTRQRLVVKIFGWIIFIATIIYFIVLLLMRFW